MTNSVLSSFLYKEYLISRPILATYLLLLLCYSGFSLLGFVDFYWMVALGQLVPFMSVYSLFHLDEQTNFQDFASLLPQGRLCSVQARYLFQLVLATVLALVYCLLFLLFSQKLPAPLPLSMAWLFSSISLGFFLSALLFPLCYRLGCHRAKPWFFLLILGLFSFFLLLRRYFSAQQAELTPDSPLIPSSPLFPLVFLQVLASLLLYFCSYRQSLKILKN